MNKIWLIIKREYLTRVKKKSFIIMTFLGPILFAALIVGAVLVGASDTTFHRVLIADTKGWIVEDEVLKYELEKTERPHFKNSDDIMFDFRKGAVDAKQEIKSEAYTIVIQLDSLSYEDGLCVMTHDKVPGINVQQEIQNDLEVALEQFRVKKLNMSWDEYKRVKRPVKFSMLDATTGEEDLTYIKAMIGFGFAIVIYLFIFIYGVQVMRGVIEEKTNRIIEVIVSSVKPFQLMMGKVIGIGMVGLTQFLMWVILTLIISTIGLSALNNEKYQKQLIQMQQPAISGAQMPVNEAMAQFGTEDDSNKMLKIIYSIPWLDVILSFIFYFIGGYLLYGSLFAAVGAAVDQETDTQQFMMPITIPLLFAYFISAFMISNPESNAGNIFAVIPLTSPIVMMVKTAIGVPIWLKLLSMASLVIAFLFFIWLAGRIYRVGILMYGKKPTYRELWKWIRYKS